MRYGWKTSGATIYGKVCTATMYLVGFLLLGIPNLSLLTVNLLLVMEMAVMVITLFSYIELYLQAALCFRAGLKAEDIDWKVLADRRRKRHKILRRSFLLTFLGFALYVAVGAIYPFTATPEVSTKTKENFDVTAYYSDTPGSDRAAIVEDNKEAYDLRLQMIAHAKKRILLSTFDIRTDETGKDILAALLAAADRGVSVELFVDGFNSWVNMESSPYFMALSSHVNGKIILYNKVNLLKPWTIMGRMHDKYLLVDDTAYLLGGRNTFNYFLGDYKGYKNHDRDILVYNTGSLSSSLYEVLHYYKEITSLDCCETFCDQTSLAWHPSVKRAREELIRRYEELKKNRPELFGNMYDYKTNTYATNAIHLLQNPIHTKVKEPVVFYELMALARQAKEDVTIHTPYLICNEEMYEGLESLGQKARVMFNSAANNGNLFAAVDYLSHMDEVVDTGVQILEYEGGISYHGKSLVIDDNLSIVGTYNLDMRSTYINTELMVVVDSKEVNEQLRNEMKVYEDKAIPVQNAGAANSMDTIRKELSTKKKIIHHFFGWLFEKSRFLL